MRYFIFLTILLSTACHHGEKIKDNNDVSSRWNLAPKTEDQALKIKNRLDQLAYLLEGSFSNEKQNLEDPLGFYNITMHVYPIWKERPDAKYFYLEQALITLPDEPYRQWIYKVSMLNQDTFLTEIYTLPNPEKFIGAWYVAIDKKATAPNVFSNLKIANLIKKNGCDVFLEWMSNGFFLGQNKVGTCLSERKATAYSILDVSLSFGKFIAWDRGLGKDGKKTWGADSGYVFERMSKEKILEILKTVEAKEEKK